MQPHNVFSFYFKLASRCRRLLSISGISFLFAVLMLPSCSNNTSDIQLTQRTQTPTKGGSTEWVEKLNDVNSTLEIAGNCDPRATDLEFSLDDGVSWTSATAIPGSDKECSDSTFSLKFPGSTFSFAPKVSDRRKMLIRHVIGAARTTAAIVTIKYIAPRGPREAAFRVVLGKMSYKGSGLDVEIKAFARGEVQ